MGDLGDGLDGWMGGGGNMLGVGRKGREGIWNGTSGFLVTGGGRLVRLLERHGLCAERRVVVLHAFGCEVLAGAHLGDSRDTVDEVPGLYQCGPLINGMGGLRKMDIGEKDWDSTASPLCSQRLYTLVWRAHVIHYCINHTAE